MEPAKPPGMSAEDRLLRIQNDGDQMLTVAIEPYGDEVSLPPGAKLGLVYREGASTAPWQDIEDLAIAQRVLQVWVTPTSAWIMGRGGEWELQWRETNEGRVPQR